MEIINNQKEARENLEKMIEGDYLRLNWLEDSGATVVYVNRTYLLWQSSDGCDDYFVQSFTSKNLAKLICIAFSWT